MDGSALLIELYGRIPPLARRAVDDLDAVSLQKAIVADSNPIGWLIWHLARVQDHHVAELLDTDQLWTTGDWAGRFGLEPDSSDIGYGHNADDVRRVQPDSPQSLLDYLDAVQARSLDMVKELGEEDLDRIVDRRWDPPVSLGVRLISIADDSLQHVGQACYLRGLFDW